MLTERGLGPAIELLAGRTPVPVTVTSMIDVRLPGPVEAAGYYVVSEALTNVAKYAAASAVRVSAACADRSVHTGPRHNANARPYSSNAADVTRRRLALPFADQRGEPVGVDPIRLDRQLVAAGPSLDHGCVDSTGSERARCNRCICFCSVR